MFFKLIFQKIIFLLKIGIAFLILPLLNLYISSLSDVFHENISHIGNALGYQSLMYIWGMVCTLYFYFIVNDIIKKMEYKNKYYMPSLSLSCFLMGISVLIPYHPQFYPILAEIHIYSAILGTTIFIFLTYHILLQLSFYYKQPFHRITTYFTFLIIFCMYIIYMFGIINSFIEIIFSSLTAILLCITQISYSKILKF